MLIGYFARKDYEPFRLVNVWKKTKTSSKSAMKKVSYKCKEASEAYDRLVLTFT